MSTMPAALAAPNEVVTLHAATANKIISEPIVLLHGWGSDDRSWGPILPQLRAISDVMSIQLPGFGGGASCFSNEQSVDDFLLSLADQLPSRFALLGWSLGGMLALQFASRYPERCSYLLTMASNMTFVVRDDWPWAMAALEFKQFCRGFRSQPDMTLKQFGLTMAAGDSKPRALGRSLMEACGDSFASLDVPQKDWSGALTVLGSMNNLSAFTALKVPGLHLFADGDALVPVPAAEQLVALNCDQKVVVIDDSSHALHWSQPQQVVDTIEAFLVEGQYKLDKHKVAESFGRAASSYDSVAQLQRDIGNGLLAGSQSTDLQDQLWLDLGCGTGYFSPKIQQNLGEVISLDLSEGMLNYARAQRDDVQHWLCADAEQLPLTDNCIEGVFTSLAIQWCSRLPQLFSEIKRVLKPGGRVLIATLGPQTLDELRQSWQSVDDYTHVNRFASQKEVTDAIDAAGFASVAWRTEYKVLRYQELKQLTYELKTLGAHNMNHGQSSGLTGRQRVKKFRQAYEQFRDQDGLLPATYEVYYIELTV